MMLIGKSSCSSARKLRRCNFGRARGRAQGWGTMKEAVRRKTFCLRAYEGLPWMPKPDQMRLLVDADEARLDAILAGMTLREKLGQMFQICW